MRIRFTEFVALLITAAVLNAQEIRHRFVVSDEGTNNIVYIDQFNPEAGWSFAVGKTSRSLQLIGDNRLMAGTADGGYHQLNLTTGVDEGRFNYKSGTASAIRLTDGNTLLIRERLSARIVDEVDESGSMVRTDTVNGLTLLRLTTLSAAGTLLFGSDNRVVECARDGGIVWEMTLPDSINAKHVWKVVRMADGSTVASTGYGASLVVLSPDKQVLKVIGGPNQPGGDTIIPNFYAGFQVLQNGHYVVTNWQAHGPDHGDEGVQILEYDVDGNLVWSFKDSTLYSSVHNILILDDLNAELLHVETDGVVEPAEPTAVPLLPAFGAMRLRSSAPRAQALPRTMSIPATDAIDLRGRHRAATAQASGVLVQ